MPITVQELHVLGNQAPVQWDTLNTAMVASDEGTGITSCLTALEVHTANLHDQAAFHDALPQFTLLRKLDLREGFGWVDLPEACRIMKEMPELEDLRMRVRCSLSVGWVLS